MTPTDQLAQAILDFLPAFFIAALAPFIALCLIIIGGWINSHGDHLTVKWDEKNKEWEIW